MKPFFIIALFIFSAFGSFAQSDSLYIFQENLNQSTFQLSTNPDTVFNDPEIKIYKKKVRSYSAGKQYFDSHTNSWRTSSGGFHTSKVKHFKVNAGEHVYNLKNLTYFLNSQPESAQHLKHARNWKKGVVFTGLAFLGASISMIDFLNRDFPTETQETTAGRNRMTIFAASGFTMLFSISMKNAQIKKGIGAYNSAVRL